MRGVTVDGPDPRYPELELAIQVTRERVWYPRPVATSTSRSPLAAPFRHLSLEHLLQYRANDRLQEIPIRTPKVS